MMLAARTSAMKSRCNDCPANALRIAAGRQSIVSGLPIAACGAASPAAPLLLLPPTTWQSRISSCAGCSALLRTLLMWERPSRGATAVNALMSGPPSFGSMHAANS